MTLYEEDTWVLADDPPDYIYTDGIYAYHHCKPDGVFTASRTKWADMNEPCNWCGKPIPESIQAMYVLLTGDMNDTQ